MLHRLALCSVACLASMLTACTMYTPSLVHPKLEALTDVDRTMKCAQIDVAIVRADTVRWLIRDDGGRLETSSERHARYAANVLVIPLSVLLRGPAVIPSPGHDVLNAADARIRELLQLKRTRGCPPRATALPGIDEFTLLSELESVQSKIDGSTGDEATLFKERTRLLDGLRLLPEPTRTSTSSKPPSELEAVQATAPIATHDEAADLRDTGTTPLPARMPKIGDTWTYRYTDLLSNRSRGPFLHRIVAVSEKQIHEHTRLNNVPDAGKDQTFTRNAEFIEQTLSGIPEFAPYLQAFDALDRGGRWDRVIANETATVQWVFMGRVIDVEKITVPAGTFFATRVELNGRKKGPSDPTGASASGQLFTIDPTQSKFVLWYAPEVKRVVKYTRETFNWNGKRLDRDMYELLEYHRLN